MHILIGIGAAVVLLYWWLVGQWFARVIVFLLVGALAGLVLFAITPQHGTSPLTYLVLIAIAGVIAWPVASLPFWYHRAMVEESKRRLIASQTHLPRQPG